MYNITPKVFLQLVSAVCSTGANRGTLSEWHPLYGIITVSNQPEKEEKETDREYRASENIYYAGLTTALYVFRKRFTVLQQIILSKLKSRDISFNALYRVLYERYEYDENHAIIGGGFNYQMPLYIPGGIASGGLGKDLDCLAYLVEPTQRACIATDLEKEEIRQLMALRVVRDRPEVDDVPSGGNPPNDRCMAQASGDWKYLASCSENHEILLTLEGNVPLQREHVFQEAVSEIRACRGMSDCYITVEGIQFQGVALRDCKDWARVERYLNQKRVEYRDRVSGEVERFILQQGASDPNTDFTVMYALLERIWVWRITVARAPLVITFQWLLDCLQLAPEQYGLQCALFYWEKITRPDANTDCTAQMDALICDSNSIYNVISLSNALHVDFVERMTESMKDRLVTLSQCQWDDLTQLQQNAVLTAFNSPHIETSSILEQQVIGSLVRSQHYNTLAVYARASSPTQLSQIIAILSAEQQAVLCEKLDENALDAADDGIVFARLIQEYCENQLCVLIEEAQDNTERFQAMRPYLRFVKPKFVVIQMLENNYWNGLKNYLNLCSSHVSDKIYEAIATHIERKDIGIFSHYDLMESIWNTVLSAGQRMSLFNVICENPQVLEQLCSDNHRFYQRYLRTYRSGALCMPWMRWLSNTFIPLLLVSGLLLYGMTLSMAVAVTHIPLYLGCANLGLYLMALGFNRWYFLKRPELGQGVKRRWMLASLLTALLAFALVVCFTTALGSVAAFPALAQASILAKVSFIVPFFLSNIGVAFAHYLRPYSGQKMLMDFILDPDSALTVAENLRQSSELSPLLDTSLHRESNALTDDFLSSTGEENLVSV